MIKALFIKNGVIQDKEIDGIPIRLEIIEPYGLPNVRTLKKMEKVIGITNHNTGNSSPTAGADAHARYLQNIEIGDKEYKSVHLFVDYKEIVQCLPLDEMGYHAGDGNGPGNSQTVAVEICENKFPTLAETNAKKLNAALLLTHPNWKIYKHQDWSGKYCPHLILDRPNGWANFKIGIKEFLKEAKPVEMVYNYIDNNMPEWARESVRWAQQNGIVCGNEKGELGLSYLELKMLAYIHRTYKLLKLEK